VARDRKVLIIAGPNGAGKTTFASEFLPKEADCPVFVNADLIAAALAPFAPDHAAMRAGRLMLQELERHFTARTSFSFETTLGALVKRQLDATLSRALDENNSLHQKSSSHLFCIHWQLY